MNIETQAIDLEKALAPSLAKFLALGARVCSGEGLAKTHSEVEVILWEEGIETLRQLFQDHLDLQSEREQPQDAVAGSDGVERTHHRVSGRGLETKFGTVRVGRIAYAARGSESLHPLDRKLNLPPDLFSFGVRRRVAEEAARGSHDAVVEALKTTTGASVGKRQVEELAVRAAKDFDAFYAGRAEVAGTLPLSGRGSILVISVDAKGIVVRHEDLREATKRAAEQEPRDRSKKLKPGEKKNRKRMATAAAVYIIGQFPRRPEDIVDEMRRRKKAEKRPRPYKKRVWASVEKDAEAVIRQAFEEAAIRDPGRKKTWVAHVDGNATQIEVLQRVAKEYGVELIIVLDVIHALGYLWDAAHVSHKVGSQEAQDWVDERFLAILEGRAGYIAAGMRQSATKSGMSKEKRKAIDKCAGYLLNHKNFMRYDEYLAAGFPIASGVIEGVCRHLIKDRMDITGARWSLEGADAVLRLRALWASGDFEEYWAFHEAQEAERNHAALFALPITPQADQAPEAKAC